jgi:hypothetical protein
LAELTLDWLLLDELLLVEFVVMPESNDMLSYHDTIGVGMLRTNAESLDELRRFSVQFLRRFFLRFKFFHLPQSTLVEMERNFAHSA